jgi:hypothetical protein
MKRVKVDSTLHIPSFCGVPTLRGSTSSMGALAYDTCNNILYKYNTQFGWTEVGGGGTTTDTTSLSNRINGKIDSLKRRTDSVFAYKNGNQIFQFKDSVGTNPPPNGYYGAFQDNTTQTAISVNTAYPVKFNTTDLTNGVTISNNTKIKIANAGIYNIQFSLRINCNP